MRFLMTSVINNKFSNLRLSGVEGLIFMCLWVLQGCSPAQKEYFVEIDDLPVTEAEFRLYLDRNIARTYNYYYQEWGVNAHTEFWETKYGDKTPKEYIKAMALAQLVEIKSRQRLATQMGLIKEFTYDSLQHWWVQDNASRKLKKASGGIVYGPVERKFEDFYDYFYASLFNNLQEMAYEKLFTPSPAEIKAYYELNKEKWFVYIPEVEAEYLEFEFDGSKDKKQLLSQVESAEAALTNGADMRSIAAGYPRGQYRHQTFVKSDEVLGEEDVEGQLNAWALGLDTNEIKTFIGRSTIYLMHGIEKAAPKAYPYDEIERDVIWYYRKNHYQELLDSLSAQAKVVINQESFDRMKVQP
ncbi:peptidylprolyl isomerase [Reichenbachiella carrageenanivorans]|uniref:Peptidylprolyl isomerase n=1 Tax=Reichenbachiella carrageenanivorans TaxID=2979869 RepID=A0ABY6CVD0_9BACT|nr:peptidylprolyl isomerase [Reichenbachiella carrageenanivorans]UXX77694.1 peptidylprolyl isomerase [Reichenbachiella carrageenanivorans]